MHLITFRNVFFLLVVAGSILEQTAQACRFNVRDVGFVDFDRSPYTLYALHNDSIPDDQIDTFHQIAFAALLDSNVELEMVNLNEATDETLKSYLPSEPVSQWPHPVLVSPNGESVSVPWVEGESYRESVWNTIDSIINPSITKEILDLCIENYGVVLLVEGEDKAVNVQAQEATEAALQSIVSNMENLPKPIKNPATSLRLSHEEIDKAALLLWSMGIPTDGDTTHAAILYGRGRQIGQIFSGQDIIKENLESILHVIGLSCECGLDRSWMMGTMIPLRWDSDRQRLASTELGFDTESPLVKSEITQIMALGQRIQEAQRGDGSISLDTLVMGYSEVSVADRQNLPAVEEPLEPVPVMEKDIEALKKQVTEIDTQPLAQHDSSSMHSTQWLHSNAVSLMWGAGILAFASVLITTLIILARGRST